MNSTLFNNTNWRTTVYKIKKSIRSKTEMVSDMFSSHDSRYKFYLKKNENQI